MNTHELKTDRGPFGDVLAGRKSFEIRRDDRGFEVGDCLLLRETEYSGSAMEDGAPLVYTDRRLRVFVTHILRGPCYGLARGWVVMSVRI